MRIHHVGYLVKHFQEAIDEFVGLGYQQGEITRDASRGIDICFVEKDGYRIEVVSPYRKDSVVSSLLKRLKNSPYHICYASSNLKADIERLESMGYLQFDEIAPAPALGGKDIVYLMNVSIGLVELVQEPC